MYNTANESDKLHKLNTKNVYKLCYSRVLQISNKLKRKQWERKKKSWERGREWERKRDCVDGATTNARNVLHKSLLTLHSINIFRTVKKCAQHKWSRWSISAVFICTHSFAYTLIFHSSPLSCFGRCIFFLAEIHFVAVVGWWWQKCDARVEKLISSYRLNVFDEFPHFLRYSRSLSAFDWFCFVMCFRSLIQPLLRIISLQCHATMVE